MIKAELTKNCKKKSFLILTIILAILSISWLISVYVSSIKTIEMGMEYTDTQLVLLEPQNIFFQCMSQITLSIYIFPFIIIGVILVYDDIKEKVILQVAVIQKSRIRYFMNKIAVLLIYNFTVLLSIFIICLCFSLLMPNINKENMQDIFSVYTIFSFLIYWMGLTFWGIVAMAITCIFNSGIAGSCVALYVLIERIYTSTSAVTIQNSLLMKLNEFLPWANFNTLFVYAGDLKTLTSDMTQEIEIMKASTLTMYKYIHYNNSVVPYPYFKGLDEIIFACIVYLLFFIAIYVYYYNLRIKKS